MKSKCQVWVRGCFLMQYFLWAGALHDSGDTQIPLPELWNSNIQWLSFSVGLNTHAHTSVFCVSDFSVGWDQR